MRIAKLDSRSNFIQVLYTIRSTSTEVFFNCKCEVYYININKYFFRSIYYINNMDATIDMLMKVTTTKGTEMYK